MTKELAFVLKNLLIGIPFVDVMAGIVQPIIDAKFKEGSTMAIARKLPIAYDVTGKGTALGLERQLVPDQSKKSILYFEDFGSSPDTTVKAGTFGFVTNIRLVFWMNKINCGYNKYSEVSAFCIQSILERLVRSSGISQNGITRLFVTNPRILIQDASIFSRYNYPEEVVQYLRPPFEYFAIDLACKYTVHGSCLTGIRLSYDWNPVKIPILIKDSPTDERQLLDNGMYVPVQYPSGTTLTIPFLIGYNVLAPFILNHNNIDAVMGAVPFDPKTMTWDVSGHPLAYFNDGDEIFINAALPRVL